MRISNLDDLVLNIRQMLPEYLNLKMGLPKGTKKLKCFVHDDNSPSMSIIRNTDSYVLKCFGCGWTGNIFHVAEVLESLPVSGPEWATETVPTLAAELGLAVTFGEPTEADIRRQRVLSLANDIAEILSEHPAHKEYMEERNWSSPYMLTGSVEPETLMNELIERRGWDPQELLLSGMLSNNSQSYFGEDKVTFTYRDKRGRAIGFISRNLEGKPKYINTSTTVVFEKAKALLGLHTAIKKGNIKERGVYVVEGPGELMQLHRLGVYNVVCIGGCAFTRDHIEELKSCGVSEIMLALDWDEAGEKGTLRALSSEVKGIQGLRLHVLGAPPDSDFKDIDSLLATVEDPEVFDRLPLVPGFQWLVSRVATGNPASAVKQLLPLVVAEPSAVGRELMCIDISKVVGVSISSVMSDVEYMLSAKENERAHRIKESIERYKRAAERNPADILSIRSQHEEELENIDRDYKKQQAIGPSYQLSRFDALQQEHQNKIDGDASSHFKSDNYSIFFKAFSTGLDLASGSLTYFAGGANSGKTATCIALVCDIVLSDPDAIGVIHLTDDDYRSLEPRIKSQICRLSGIANAPIGLFADPKQHAQSTEDWDIYNRTNEIFRSLLAEEKLVILDSEDGRTLSVVENNLRYIRARHPQKKICVVMDSTFNYESFSDMDRRHQIGAIATTQKTFATKYRCAIFATAEFRKPPSKKKHDEMVLPSIHDIAEARELSYRSQIVISVYNDVHERKEYAEYYHGTKQDKRARLMLRVDKNKMNSYKSSFFMDMDPSSATLKEVSWHEATRDFEKATVTDEEVDEWGDTEHTISTNW